MKNRSGSVSDERADQRAEQFHRPRRPDRKPGHGGERASGGGKGPERLIVLGRVHEQDAGADLAELQSDRDDDDAGDDRRK